MYYKNIDGETALMDTARTAMTHAGVKYLPAPAYRALLKYEAPREPLYDELRERLVARAGREYAAALVPANERIRAFVREYGYVDRDDEQGLAGRLPARWGHKCSLWLYIYVSGTLICLMGWRRDDKWCPSMIVTGSHHDTPGDGEPPLPVYIGQMIERMKSAPRAHL